MKSIKKILLCFALTLSILTLFACGVNKSLRAFTGFSGANYAVEETAVDYGAKNFVPYVTSAKMMTMNDSVEMEGAGSINSNKKLIKTIDIVSETKEFEDALTFIKSQVNTNNGVIDNSYVDSGNSTTGGAYKKSANFTLRIPVEKTDKFLTNVKEKLNITFEQESVRDVTDTYDDTESRKETLNIEEGKLNELLKKAKNVDEIIKIEEKLSDVRRELQNIENRLKRLDKQIDYTTINITINEVIDYTEYVKKEDLSKENLIKRLNKNLADTKRFVVNAGVFLFVHIPAICLGLFVLLVILLIILIIKSVGKSKTKPKNKVSTVKKVQRKTNKRKKTDNISKTENQEAENIEGT